MAEAELVAIYSDPDAAMKAVEALRAQGVPEARLSSPAGYPVVHAVDQGTDSRAQGGIALFGGLTGLSTAIALQVVTSRELNIIVGGKPIVSWPAFGVIMFELTMLFAGASNFLALLVLGALARRRVSKAARDQVNSERIVVIVPTGGLAPALQAVARTVLGAALSGVQS